MKVVIIEIVERLAISTNIETNYTIAGLSFFKSERKPTYKTINYLKPDLIPKSIKILIIDLIYTKIKKAHLLKKERGLQNTTFVLNITIYSVFEITEKLSNKIELFEEAIVKFLITHITPKPIYTINITNKLTTDKPYVVIEILNNDTN